MIWKDKFPKENRYYETENGILYCADCLNTMKQMPENSIDLLLTDPPYGMNFKSNRRKNKYERIVNDDNLNWVNDFIDYLFNIVKNNTAHYMFTSFHNIDIFKQAIESKFKIKNLLVWEKNNASMGDLKGDFAPKVEFIWFFQKGRRLINGKRDPNIFKFNRTGDVLHPTQKPVNLIKYLITKFSDENNLVFDPFLGSGTTAIACEQLNRRWIGIEISEEYCEIAVKRIKEWHAKKRLM